MSEKYLIVAQGEQVPAYELQAIFLAAQGITRPWKMQQHKLSPRFTIRWSELLTVTWLGEIIHQPPRHIQPLLRRSIRNRTTICQDQPPSSSLADGRHNFIV